jgi:hypothetical protein
MLALASLPDIRSASLNIVGAGFCHWRIGSVTKWAQCRCLTWSRTCPRFVGPWIWDIICSHRSGPSELLYSLFISFDTRFFLRSIVSKKNYTSVSTIRSLVEVCKLTRLLRRTSATSSFAENTDFLLTAPPFNHISLPSNVLSSYNILSTLDDVGRPVWGGRSSKTPSTPPDRCCEFCAVTYLTQTF